MTAPATAPATSAQLRSLDRRRRGGRRVVRLREVAVALQRSPAWHHGISPSQLSQYMNGLGPVNQPITKAEYAFLCDLIEELRRGR